MKRFVAALTVAGAATLAGVVTAAPAAAEPSLCLHVDISVQGEEQVQDICLPPEGIEPPALPGLGL